MPRRPHQLLTAAEFRLLADRLDGIERSNPDPLRGLPLARMGRVVSVGEAPPSPFLDALELASPGSPTPYRLNRWQDSGDDWTAINDRIELDIHGAPAMTHLDAPDHFRWGGRAIRRPIGELAATGLVGRGILIDVSILGGSAEGQVVTLADVEQVLERIGVEPAPGDALYFAFGQAGRGRSDAPLGSAPMSGLSIECAEWLAHARPSLVVTDLGLDPLPSEVSGYPVPWHLLLLTVLGIPLVDWAAVTKLAAVCTELERWEFLSVIAPLPLTGASGSPVNPLAIF